MGWGSERFPERFPEAPRESQKPTARLRKAPKGSQRFPRAPRGSQRNKVLGAPETMQCIILVLGQLLERIEWMESEPDFPSFPFSCIAFILCGELALLRFRVRAPFWSWGPRWEYKGGIGGISSGVIPPTPPTITGSSLCGSSIWIRFSPPRKCAAAAAAAATEKSARR
jgi:hypothetical protein